MSCNWMGGGSPGGGREGINNRRCPVSARIPPPCPGFPQIPQKCVPRKTTWRRSKPDTPTPPRHPRPRSAHSHPGSTQRGKATRTEMVPALLTPHPQRHLPRPEPRDGVAVPAGPGPRLRPRFPSSFFRFPSSSFLCFPLPLHRLTPRPPRPPHIPVDPRALALHQLHRLPLPAVVGVRLGHLPWVWETKAMRSRLCLGWRLIRVLWGLWHSEKKRGRAR